MYYLLYYGKRTLAVLLAIIMVWAMMPMQERKVSAAVTGTITDSWEEIIASCNDGTYKTKYSIGDTKELDLGSEGVVEMQIAAFDADKLADSSGTAAITWISKQLLKSDHRMNPARETDPSDSSKYKLGTGSIGGWKQSEMRSWLNMDIKPLIPSVVRNAIKPVKKYSTSYDTSGNFIQNEVTADSVWIPSYREMGGTSTSCETEGPAYTGCFTSLNDRVKQKTGASGNSAWWLRTSDYNDSYGFSVALKGGAISIGSSISADREFAVALGFCMGAKPGSAIQGVSITDSWSTIIANINNGTYKSKYNIGDKKELDLGPEGIVEMQIAAFDADELADGSGTAAITWISKQPLNLNHRMNPARESDPSDSSKYKLGTGSIGGWANSEMRAWLKSDVKPLIPFTVLNAIRPVKKYSTSYDTAGNFIRNEVTIDDVWIPSYREIGGTESNYETNGPAYTDLYKSMIDRVKQKTGAFYPSYWWLRSAYHNFGTLFRDVETDGYTGKDAYAHPGSEEAVVLGFCMGENDSSGIPITESPKPEFTVHSLVLSGEIGVNFFMDLPGDVGNYSDSYMEFTVNGETQRVDFDENFRDQSGRGYYGFTCYVTSVQMADTIEAVYHYGDKTVTQNYTVVDYLSYFEDPAHAAAFNEKTLNLIYAIDDYGYYSQPFLAANNNWTVGVEHTQMTLHHAEEYDLEDIKNKIEGYTIEKEIEGSGIVKVTQRLLLDSETTVDVFLTVEEGMEVSASATFNGKEYPAELQEDGRYLVRIPGISAHLLGTPIIVEGTAADQFKVTTTALTYVKSLLNNSQFYDNIEARNAMASLYQYYDAVMKYRNSTN